MANDTEQRVTNLEATVAEFVAQAARLLGDHGSRLSRVEAQLETLTALFQASDRRLNQLEESIRNLQEVTRTNANAIGNLQQTVQTLAAIVQSNETRFRQLAESQVGVLQRMDDVIAVLQERL